MQLKNSMINIETTNRCIANCIICPRESFTQKIGVMSEKLFYKIVNDCIKYNIETFDLCGFGEPFTDHMLWNRLDFLKYKLPKAKTYISTTGHLMNSTIYDRVCQYIDILKLSVYGTTKDVYESVHRGAVKFEKSVNNILGLLEREDKPYTIGLFVLVDENKDQKNDWLDMWEDKLDEVFIWEPHNWVDYRNYRTLNPGKQASCGRPINGPLYIHVDGSVSPCCWDINKRLKIGDMNNQTIEEVFHSKEFKKIQEAHLNNKLDGLICEKCDQTNYNTNSLIYSNSGRKIGELIPNRSKL